MKLQINTKPKKPSPVLFKAQGGALVLELANGKYVILESNLEHEIRSIVELDEFNLVEFNGSITLSND